MKEQFFGASTDDAAAHLNNFVELRMLKVILLSLTCFLFL
jgi:hypothetical protein